MFARWGRRDPELYVPPLARDSTAMRIRVVLIVGVAWGCHKCVRRIGILYWDERQDFGAECCVAE